MPTWNASERRYEQEKPEYVEVPNIDERQRTEQFRTELLNELNCISYALRCIVDALERSGR